MTGLSVVKECVEVAIRQTARCSSRGCSAIRSTRPPLRAAVFYLTNIRDNPVERRCHPLMHLPPGRRLRRRSARNRSLGTAARPPSAGCERTPSGSRSCSRSNEVSIASRLRVPDPGTFSNASWRRARRSPLRRLRRRRRLSGRVVEVGAVLVRERVLEFAPFVDRARRFRSGVIGDATRQREPPEQPCKLELAKLQVVGGAPVRVQSFQQARRQRCRHGESRKAMSGAEGVASSIR